MKYFLKKLSICLTILILIGCAHNTHTVGAGPQTGETVSARQWYFLYYIPLNEVDSSQMAGDAVDYEIRTEVNFVDLVIPDLFGIGSMTVTVTK